MYDCMVYMYSLSLNEFENKILLIIIVLKNNYAHMLKITMLMKSHFFFLDL
jgi:hypothetical protein